MKKIKVDGFGVDRRLYVDEILLAAPGHQRESFNWGYEGAATDLASYSLLRTQLSEDEATLLMKPFTAHILSRITMNNFSMLFHVEQWIEDARANKLKPTEAYMTFLDPEQNFMHIDPKTIGGRIGVTRGA